ncbi:MAG: M23 family metallopeptidase [Bacillota bacterium]
MSYNQEEKRITIKIIPHSIADPISFSSPQIVLKLILGLLILYLISSTLGCYFYYQQHQKALAKINTLTKVEEDNKRLKSKLKLLTTETEELKVEFKKVKQISSKIKKLVDYKISKVDAYKFPEFGVVTAREFNKQQNSYRLRLELYEAREDSLLGQAANNLIKIHTYLPIQQVKLKQLKKSVVSYNQYLAAKPTGWPIKSADKQITSHFGWRIHPITGKRIRHEGIDIGVWYGTEIYATGAGEVTYAGWKSGYGKTVVIDHGYNFRTLYAHNRRLDVEVGEKVKRGDLIAYSGNSGRSTGPHLHYEVILKNEPVNPWQYIK